MDAPTPAPVPVTDAASVPPPAPVPPLAPVPPVPPAPAGVASPPATPAWSATAYGPTGVAPAYASAPVAPPVATWAPPVARPQNVLAWVAFGLGLGGLMMGLVTSIPAIILGHIARRQIRERGEQGDAAALTGLIAGYVLSALWILGIAAYVLFFVVIFAAAGVSSGFGSSI